MPRISTTWTVRWAVLAGSACLLAAAPARAAPIGFAARRCTPPQYPGSGYFTSLRVTRVSCSTGRRVTLAHYHCRVRSGPAGRCHSRVLGYRCVERRQAIKVEFDSIVTCQRGRRRVVYSYQQNT
jgi:hypothetical protein